MTHPWKPAPPSKRKPNPERQVVKAIKQALGLKGYLVIAVDAGGAAAYRRAASAGVELPPGGVSEIPAGFPDLLCLSKTGRAVFVEVKAPGNKPSPIQEQWLAVLMARGFVAFWADSVASVLQQLEMLEAA